MPDLEDVESQSPMPATDSADPREAPHATHPGELYVLREAGGRVYLETEVPGFGVDFGEDQGGSVEPYPTQVLRRLVHCRNLIDGPEEYAERCDGEEHREIEAGLRDLSAELNERLALRIAERFEDWLDRLGFLEQAQNMFNMCPGCGFLSSSKPAHYVQGVPCPSCRETYGHHFGFRRSLLAVCREEVARWAEPPLQDAPSARPDALVSPEDAGRGGE